MLKLENWTDVERTPLCTTVFHTSADTLNRSKHKQVVQLVSSSCMLAVCKPTLHISPPAVLDSALDVQACPGTERHY